MDFVFVAAPEECIAYESSYHVDKGNIQIQRSLMSVVYTKFSFFKVHGRLDFRGMRAIFSN